MRVRRVYIKKAGGEIASEACYTAWRGFSHLGYQLDFFEWDDLVAKCLPLDRATLLVGGTVAVHKALKQIGVEPPRPLNIPSSLTRFAGRDIGESNLEAVRRDFESGRASPLFIKPLVQTKTLTGRVIERKADLDALSHLESDLLLQTASLIDFVSEWRLYVHRNAVVGIAHYKGDWSLVPTPEIVGQAISAYEHCPVAYSLDFGISREGKTLLVEANDAFALGAHGIDAVAYAKMLEDRWIEITGG
jgi:hypothetical protein